MFFFLTDQERTQRLENQVEKLTNAYTTSLKTLSQHQVIIKVLQQYLQVLSYLLFKDDLVSRETFLKRLAKSQERESGDNDEYAKMILQHKDKINSADSLGLDGFLSKPDLGDA